MPIGIQRLNARHQPPTDRIIFIKPLPGPDATISEEFLSRVAAICHPIMKSHHLSVMTLEEFEPNREFIGRNFNAGEVIQLVLRTHSGAWLGFRSVVMVMMHELAHCVQMNHSREFWKVRNMYAGEMRELWGRGYTGEGVWGPGRSIGNGQFENRRVHEGDLPEHLCGGTYRSRRRGRKRKREGGDGREKLSYAERQQRRIAKKFGVMGQALGQDEVIRNNLERSRSNASKPRVANSKRGRELRAQAALARFEQQSQVKLPFKKEEPGIKTEELEDDSESESDYDDPSPDEPVATDADGREIHDSNGRGLVKVCPEEDVDDVHVKSELQELQDLDRIPFAEAEKKEPKVVTHDQGPQVKRSDKRHAKKTSEPQRVSREKGVSTSKDREISYRHPEPIPAPPGTCAICSLLNTPGALTCAACAHVLKPSKAPGHWKCESDTCKESAYINAGDSGRCGLCGNRKDI